LALFLQCVSVSADSLRINNATIMTMGSMGTLREADVFIENGEITAIGADLPGAADQVIDADGAIITPAMFAGATTTGLVEVSAVSESVDSSVSETPLGKLHVEFDVRRAYSPHSSLLGITRSEGFGYSLLAATGGQFSIAGVGSLVDFDGGFDSFSGSDTVFIDVDGYSSRKVGGSRAAHWMLLEGAMADLQRRASEQEYLTQAGRNVLKRLKADGIFVFSANRAADIKQVLKFVDDHNVKAVIVGAREAWMLAEELADSDVPVMINGLDNLPADFDSLGARLDNAALLSEAGVTVMFTSDETHNARKIRQGAGTAVAYGMDYNLALQAMTTTAAEVFEGRSRVLAEGNSADLVVWSGDPLEVTSYAIQVIIEGEPISMVSRQTKLLERYLPEDAGMGRAYINR
ncbi:MAG: amidohydrolase family protein, partial [Gammaproteobacteria bacterium]|nr:amidohydrolase family protein [Gammaproteobacteria bacterium]